MPTNSRYHILSLGLRLGLLIGLSVAGASAQRSPTAPSLVDMYCSGVALDQAPPNDSYIISGEDSRVKNTFHQGDHVYINRGADQGVRVGDEFEVIRAASDMMPNKWFKWQEPLSKAMGTLYSDIGVLRVIKVEAKTSITELANSCDLMLRGDLVRPLTARTAPPFHNVKFDPFAAPSGKKTAMVVYGKNYTNVSGLGKIVYINLGAGQGVQVGDYFRVFRYQGTADESVYQVPKTAYQAYGQGSTPVPYEWNDLPRQVLGEGIVLRAGPNASTVLLTVAREEIFSGDYVELE
jgi:hypothetical protein